MVIVMQENPPQFKLIQINNLEFSLPGNILGNLYLFI